MKTAINVFVVWLALSAVAYGQLAPDSYLNRDTGLVFPKLIGTYTRGSVHEYQDKRLGVAISYAGEAKTDVFIYDNGYSDIATGTDSERVRLEFLRVQQELMSEAGKAPFFGPQKILETAPAAKIEVRDKVAKVFAAMYFFSMKRRDGTELQFESWILLTGFKGKFLKLRFSLPKRDPKLSQAELRSFITKFLEANPNEQSNFLIEKAAEGNHD
jgi:hypothetical protein